MVTSIPVILGLFFSILFVFLALGTWIGVTVGVVGVASLGLLVKGSGLQLFILTVYNQLQGFTLTAVPLFIFLGEILLHTKIGVRLYRGLMGVMAPIPGGGLALGSSDRNWPYRSKSGARIGELGIPSGSFTVVKAGRSSKESIELSIAFEKASR